MDIEPATNDMPATNDKLCLSRILDVVDTPVKMGCVGVLVGRRFDTATQVALMSIAAMSASSGGVPVAVAMVMPVRFFCGMCLVDAAIGCLMLLACI